MTLQIIIFSYCVCVCVVVLACARARVCVCVHACGEKVAVSPRPLLPTKRRSLKRATWFFMTAEAFLSSAE